MKPSETFTKSYRDRVDNEDSWGVNDAPKERKEETRPYRAMPSPSAQWLLAIFSR